jgi:hypothetical protein
MLHSLVVAGEGETDMGVCANQQRICTGQDFAVGAVAILLFKLIRQHLPDWNNDNLAAEPTAHLTFIYRAWLKEQSKANKRQVFVGKQVVKGFEVYFRHAAALAQYAKQHDHQMAAYFHDTDNHDWQTLRNAIKAGFLLGNANYNRQDLCNLVETLDTTQIDMPSFNELCEQVKTAITALCGECRD